MIDSKFKIAILDDNIVDARIIEKHLRTNFPLALVELFENDSHLIKAISVDTYTCVLIDYHLNGCCASEVIEKINNKNIRIPIIVMSGNTFDNKLCEEVIKIGAINFFSKQYICSEGIRVVIQNSIELFKVREDLKNSLAEARESSITKEKFLANISHEIRTPLNAILGYIELIEKIKLDPIPESHVHKIKFASNNLLVIVNDLLDYTKLDLKYLTLFPVKFPINRIADQVSLIFSDLANQKQIDLKVINDSFIPSFFGDEKRISQIVHNLVSNAIKYTPKGGYVKVLLTSEDKQNDYVDLILEVKDNGIGIHPDQQKDIFDAFKRTEKANKYYQGTGLGLSIVKSLTDLMNGEILLSSNINKGSTFTVKLTLPQKQSFKKSTTHNKPYKKICIIDDDSLNLNILSEYLLFFDLKVNTFKSYNEFKSNHDFKDFDFYLLDVNMPEINGLEIAREIRHENKSLGLVVMSAKICDDEIEALNNIKDVNFLLKPIQFEQLKSILKIDNIPSASEDYPLELMKKLAPMLAVYGREYLKKLVLALEQRNVDQLNNLNHKIFPHIKLFKFNTSLSFINSLKEELNTNKIDWFLIKHIVDELENQLLSDLNSLG